MQMKYLYILIEIIFKTITGTFKLLMKTPAAVIEWFIIGIFLVFFGLGLLVFINKIILLIFS